MKHRIGILSLGCSALMSVAPAAYAAERWEFTLAPYLLAPLIDGETTLGRAGGDLSVKPADILRNLEGGGMVHLEGRHDSGVGFALDYAFMKLGKGAQSPVGQIDAGIEQSILELYGTYRLSEGASLTDIYAGVRHWDIDVDLNVLAGPAAGRILRGGEWSDPVIGLRWQKPVATDVRFIFQGDIGGFGLGSDFTWSAMGGLAFDRWENTSAFVMYRALGVDYQSGTQGTASFFAYDTVTHGLQVGIGFHF